MGSANERRCYITHTQIDPLAPIQYKDDILPAQEIPLWR